MTINEWITNRIDDMFIIVDDDGNVVYDARSTIYEPQTYIMDSVITEEYAWHRLTVLSI